MAERLEDAFAEVVKKFPTTQDFISFALSVNGLVLGRQDVTTITVNHRFSVEEQKRRMLLLWVDRNPNATSQRIRNLVKQYYEASDQAVDENGERLEDVFKSVINRFKPLEFKHFARSGQGLSLAWHEVETITENNRFSVEERNLSFLWKWRHSTYPDTTSIADVIRRIRQLVDGYIHGEYQAEEPLIIHGQNQVENDQNVMESISEISLCESNLPIKRGKYDEDAKNIQDFLEVVKNHTEQMLEHKLKLVKSKTKMDDFILPKVTVFNERESDEQTSFQSVDITKIHSNNSVNHVMLLGDTGSGKTTFALIYTMKALKNKLDFSEEIKMVYFVHVSKLQGDERSTAFDLLFVQQLGSKFPEHLHEVGQKWFKLNSKHIVLVVDGLDQSQKSFENVDRRISTETPAETNIIITNILSGHIYSGMKVLSTTRRHTYCNLPSNLKESLTLVLGGWDDVTLDRLSEKLFDSEPKRFIHNLKEKAPGLVSNPMFFFYMVQVLKVSWDCDVGTSTNLMVRVLKRFFQSLHKRNINNLVPNLMKLAYHGMVDNKFDFMKNYIESIGLDMKDMHGLVEVVADMDVEYVDNEFVEYVADNDDLKIRFAHQSIQELLASLHACNFGSEEFKTFIRDNYEKPEMEVVIKHIFGTILNKSTFEKAKKYVAGKLDVKSEYLMTHLNKLFKGKEVISDQRAMALLHECGPDVTNIVSSGIEKIELKCLFQPGEQHAALTVVKNMNLNYLKLLELEVHPENYYSLQCVLGSVRNIYVDLLLLIKCDTDAEKLKTLTETAGNQNLKIGWKLAIKESPALEPIGYHYAIALGHHGQAQRLGLNGCDLNAKKILKMNEAVIEYGFKLNELDINGNPKMDAEAFQQLAKLLINTEGKRLHAEYCTPTSEQLSSLCASLEKEKVELRCLYLRRSTTESLTNDELLILSKLVQRVRWLEFHDQVLNDAQLDFLDENTKELCPRVEIHCETWGLLSLTNRDVFVI